MQPRINSTRTRTAIAHPAYCDLGRCEHHGYAVHHRSAPEIFLPRQRDTTEVNMVHVSVERLDEINEDSGRQTEHPAEVVFSDDRGTRTRIGIEDLRDLTGMAFALYNADIVDAVGGGAARRAG